MYQRARRKWIIKFRIRVQNSCPWYSFNSFCFVLKKNNLNKIINKFLLAGDKFMSEMHLRQPEFTYSACGSFNKAKKEYKNLKIQPEEQL